MNVSHIIRHASETINNETLFFATIAIQILHETNLSSFLTDGLTVHRELEELVSKEKHGNPLFKPTSKDFIPKLNHWVRIQQNILSCPEIDEHVVLLAALKSLDERGSYHQYKQILREILEKNLHKMDGKKSDSQIIGRTKETDEIMGVLSRTFRNNVLLTGAVGVGKTTLALSMKEKLQRTNFYQLFPAAETFMDQVVTLLSSSDEKKNIFFLDELFTFDVNHIKYLIDNSQIIATANEASYQKFASDYPAVTSKLEVIELEEQPTSEIATILSTHQKRITESLGTTWEADTIKELFELSKIHLPDPAFPAKGISLFEESAYLAAQQNRKNVTVADIRTIIAQKANIPISSVTDFDKKDLSLLPEKLESRVKGQTDAIQKVAQTIQRARLGLSKKQKPIGSFLFIGPSGVGKTELAKAVAAEVFGDTEAMVRLDMSEFAESHMVQRLIGSPPGYIGFEEGGQLTNPIKAKPYSLVLLDELEKAHPRVFDIFLQILDDGRLTDGQGKKVDFRHTVIIATSNAGLDDILDLINEGKSRIDIEKEVKEILTDYFRIEFLNRFDHIVVFNSLSKEALKDITILHLEKLSQELSKRNIILTFNDQTLETLSIQSVDPRFGARGLIRLMQDTVENKLADMIIKNEIVPGQTVEF